MSLLRASFYLALASLCSACIGPLAPYEPLISPLLPEPDCTDSRTAVDASGRVTEVPAPARCEVAVEVPLPKRRHR